jgi:deazaflavin-dependent oxidoreductase (nitroreductase family)
VDFRTVNPGVIDQFRAGQEIEGLPGVSRKDHILLTTVGRRTGERRTVPLRIFLADGDRLVVVAGNGGAPSHPAWYLNLLGDPRATVETTEESYDAVATVLNGDERDDLWKLFHDQNPGMAEYLAGASGRVIPVVALARAN